MHSGHFDIIIAGAGASGLLLLNELCAPHFKDLKVLVVDPVQRSTNDHTWCYWDDTDNELDQLLHHQWPVLTFVSKSFKKDFDILPFRYKMLRSADFYQHVWAKVEQCSNIRFLETPVTALQPRANGGATVVTPLGSFSASKIFNSIPPVFEPGDSRYFLWQHFGGWYIKTDHPAFQPEKATFMDFTVPQKKGEVRFVYVLPVSTTEALVEYTLFSKEKWSEKDYEKELLNYLDQRGYPKYSILEKEFGAIPMATQSPVFSQHPGMFYIGTSGGSVKASTGFAFIRMYRQAKSIAADLSANRPLNACFKSNRFSLYDRTLLNAIVTGKADADQIFTDLFRKSDVRTLLTFLDEGTTLWQDIQIMQTAPRVPFIKAFFQEVLHH